MPVVIRELVVRATVGAPPTNGRAATRPGARASAENSDRLVAAAVEKVMEILEREKER